ncbi:MAG: hypothetical protein QGG71_21230 [Pirellulaceae bacterium]|jgi:hypothetical protein|nr:hypothetical protein [Pirellulaceae bacterium]
MKDFHPQPDSRLQIALRPEAQTRRGKAVFKLLRALDGTQWWPRQRLEREQFKFLQQLLDHARTTTDYYAAAMVDVRSTDADVCFAGHRL